jgi:hypothetical protein
VGGGRCGLSAEPLERRRHASRRIVVGSGAVLGDLVFVGGEVDVVAADAIGKGGQRVGEVVDS